MDVIVREENGCLVTAVRGRLDTMTVPDFEQRMDALVRGEGRKVVLDLGGLDYISSAGLRSVLAFSRRVKAAGGGVALCGLTGLPLEIFQISRFDTLFTLHGGVEEAIKSL